MARTNWDSLNTLDTQKAFEHFILTTTKIINKFDPIKLVVIPANQVKQNPWITKGLLISSKTLDQIYKLKMKKPRTDPSHANYIIYRNYLNRLKRSTKRQYFSDQLNIYKTNIRKTWQILNDIVGKNNNKSCISEFF